MRWQRANCTALVGLPRFTDSAWEQGTPKEVIAKLNGAAVNTLNDPAIRKKLAEQSYEVGTREEQTPEYLGKFHKAEIERWWPIIKAAGIKPQ